jgi:serine kinase of HPr protein (carbohydrate metabolism regulator)
VSAGETVHATCVSIGGRAVLLTGKSGAGKSDLALRLIDRGAVLVSDDYTLVAPSAGRLLAEAPETIRGRIEVRGIGIVQAAAEAAVPVCLIAELARPVERLPDAPEIRTMAGVQIPAVAISALEASAPIKVELALQLFGLPPP